MKLSTELAYTVIKLGREQPFSLCGVIYGAHLSMNGMAYNHI